MIFNIFKVCLEKNILLVANMIRNIIPIIMIIETIVATSKVIFLALVSLCGFFVDEI